MLCNPVKCIDLDNLKNVVTTTEFKNNGGKLLLDKDGETLNEKKNSHQFQLRRLQFELEQRQELLKDQKTVKSEVTSVASFQNLRTPFYFLFFYKTQQVNTTRKDLIEDTLGAKLKNLFTAATPLREVFNLPRPTLTQPRNSM